MRYRIIDDRLGPLESNVNEAIKEGWTPIGGVASTTHYEGGGVLLIQAMIKTTHEPSINSPNSGDSNASLSRVHNHNNSNVSRSTERGEE